jgi:hypothetical protein
MTAMARHAHNSTPPPTPRPIGSAGSVSKSGPPSLSGTSEKLPALKSLVALALDVEPCVEFILSPVFVPESAVRLLERSVDDLCTVACVVVVVVVVVVVDVVVVAVAVVVVVEVVVGDGVVVVVLPPEVVVPGVTLAVVVDIVVVVGGLAVVGVTALHCLGDVDGRIKLTG